MTSDYDLYIFTDLTLSLMKISNYLLLSIILISSLFGCGKQGLEGKKSLIDLVNEIAGPNCPNGGYKILSGIDQNNNNALDVEEVQSTKYICNGVDGKNTLTALLAEAPGVNCTTGGYKIGTGLDLNGNNILDANEVINSQYICNGLTGINSLASMVAEPAGNHCPTGGYKIVTGADINKNGVLDVEEIQNTAYVCNGINGSHSLAALVPEPAGPNCVTGGYKINTGIDLNSNKILDASEILSAQYICNGLTGNNTLVAMVAEASGPNCANGGYKVNSGIDINKNGTLESIEIQNSSYVCNGINGLNYLIAVKPEVAGPNCIYGGYSFKTGIDLNKNAVLDNDEVTNTTFICNSSAISEIRIPLDFSANTTSTQGVSGLAVSNFNKANYLGLESIVFAARPYSGTTANNAIVTLINSTDNIKLNGSILQSNKVFEDSPVQYSANLYDLLPSKPVNISLEIKSENNGSFSAVYGTSYLILSVKK